MDRPRRTLCRGVFGGLISLFGIIGLVSAAPFDYPFSKPDGSPVIVFAQEKADSQKSEWSAVAILWDQKLPADDHAEPCKSSRFTCIWPDAIHPDGTAVRDNETGLVWERTADMETRDWFEAVAHCANREVGGRKGWRLPQSEQLASLVDVQKANPALPNGHPFSTIQSGDYWSASTSVMDHEVAWDVRFGSGMVGTSNKMFRLLAWCVRGGQAIDGQTLMKVQPAS